jgi:DNA-binding CsgD family transcriptional regulator
MLDMVEAYQLYLGEVRLQRLSRRERETLLWACRGKTYSEIGMILGVSFGTVKQHLDTAKLKLNAANLVQAAALAVAYDVISREEISDGHYQLLAVE